MSKIEKPSLVSKHSHFKKLLNDLRAGDTRSPHIESARNLLFGKLNPDKFSCRRLLMFDPQEFEKSNSYASEVLSKEDALAIITEEYVRR